MKAVLLAAGVGERLRPLTDSVPKCMVPLGGTPVLEHNVTWLRDSGVTELAINLHHLPHLVQAHFRDGDEFGVHIEYLTEPALLGTAGTVAALESWLKNEETFLVVYGDNFHNCNLSRMVQRHHDSRALVTVALHWREDVSASGVAELDRDARVVRFIEKPSGDAIDRHWVNAGLMACRNEVLEHLRRPPPADFGRDVLPGLAEGAGVQGYQMRDDESVLWIDRPEDLANAERAFLARAAKQ